MSAVPRALADEVILRARGRCEYCLLSQIGQEATFHIDHVTPRATGGLTTLENLALACVSCSLRKGAKQSAIDPDTNDMVPIFNPRLQNWHDHFKWDAERVLGLSPTGRVTIATLGMNRPIILAIRLEEMLRDRHPPS